MSGKPHHHDPTYRRLAPRVVAAANANPDTRCWRCNQLARPGDPWQAGHLIDGDITAGLAPEHRSCNSAAGAARTNSRHDQPVDWLPNFLERSG